MMFNNDELTDAEKAERVLQGKTCTRCYNAPCWPRLDLCKVCFILRKPVQFASKPSVNRPYKLTDKEIKK